MTRTKRMAAPTEWQLAKKEKKYVVSTAAGPHNGAALPIGVWLRDHMHLAENTKEAKKILLEKEIEILITLGDGDASAVAWGCDLTYDYVKINGDYRT